jgi:hypothetical protein
MKFITNLLRVELLSSTPERAFERFVGRDLEEAD